MQRFSFVLAVVLSMSFPIAAESPETDALLDFVFAKNVTSAMKHLPVQVQQELSTLPRARREEVGQEFIVFKRLEGVVLTRGHGSVLVTATLGSNEYEVVLVSRLSDGVDAVLSLEMHDKNAGSRVLENFDVWMHMEEDEWRVVSMGRRSSDFNFKDTKLLERLKGGKREANEASAVGAIRTINSAAETYAASYPDLGYPENLNVLSSPRNPSFDEYDATHAGLVDVQLTTPPFENSGYRFAFISSGSSPRRAYTISARPVEYGSSAKRSFFSNETGVIRYTDDDREANEHDSPLP
ncbi:MAG TPA: hypothetical protein VMU24_12175 [Candidatus Acidoferrales bacterium]|nr:hypothetical protein [Candidatus Acidoferrales bacterium]